MAAAAENAIASLNIKEPDMADKATSGMHSLDL
jgi:hypothetical protein